MEWPPLVHDLDTIAARAGLQHNDTTAFRYYVELDERTDAALDTLVAEIAQPIIDAIDCTACANCCRVLDVYLMASDVENLTLATGDRIETLEHTTIDRQRAAEVDEWGVLKHKPCTFLDDKLCSIYAHRPQSCRLYPTFTPDFRWTLEDVFGGVGLCPIIYNVIERLKIVLQW